MKKLQATYRKFDLLILDEWLIRPLTPEESYELLEIVEMRCERSMIFARSTNRMAGIHVLIPTLKRIVPSQRRLWTALSTIRMTLW